MTFPAPDITELNRPYWESLEKGELTFQRCERCGHNWLPARERCPACLAPESQWLVSSGQGAVISWVVYHVAYHEAFESKIPYNVAVVELAEGPRLLTNVTGKTAEPALCIGAAVELSIEREAGQVVARFRLSADNEGL